MPTQNVNLTPELDRFVKEAVARGEFNNASEVHRAALAAPRAERCELNATEERYKRRR